jgi:hypothetical protein
MGIRTTLALAWSECVFEIDGVLRTEASVLGLALPSLRLVLLRSASLVSVSGLGLGLGLG